MFNKQIKEFHMIINGENKSNILEQILSAQYNKETCLTCNNIIPLEAIYCPHCGKQIKAPMAKLIPKEKRNNGIPPGKQIRIKQSFWDKIRRK